VIKVTTEIAALVHRQFKFVANLHANGAVTLHANYFGYHLVADCRISHSHLVLPPIFIKINPLNANQPFWDKLHCSKTPGSSREFPAHRHLISKPGLSGDLGHAAHSWFEELSPRVNADKVPLF
jgi:hypothetical protein